ncbi:MAG: methyltransferase domain-containing protein [Pyrinomonadaceae bacterium]
MMTREEKLLLHVKKDGFGAEIGASHAPIAPKKSGYNVDIIDHATREELIEKYKDDNVNLDNIEEVDFVWSGEDYSELTGKTGFYDWIIASHVIEHVPNLIGFLNSCDKILKETGVLSLAIPDARFCFDHFRPLTGLSKVLDAHYQNPKVHTPGSIVEYNLNLVLKDNFLDWGENALLKEEYSFSASREEVLNALEKSLENKEYVDCHAWCFTPHSFRLMIHDLYELGFIKLQEVDFFESEGCEFFIALGRNGKGNNLSRLEMLQAVNIEILKGTNPSLVLKTGLIKMKDKARFKFRNFIRKNRRRLGL